MSIELEAEAMLIKNFSAVRWIKVSGQPDKREPIDGFVDLTFDVPYQGEMTFRVTTSYASQFDRDQIYQIKFDLKPSKTKSGKSVFYPSTLLFCEKKK
jgi:hypothetical protein